MVRARRWLGIVVAAVGVSGCPAEEAPKVENPSSAAVQGTPLETQIRSGRESLLAGVEAQADRKAIMKEISKQLGVQCDYCHDVADFGARTPNKAIANYMFNHYSAGEEKKGGGLVTCGTCHGGQAKFLGDRGEKDRVKGLMQTQFIDALQIRGGKALECATCHGAKVDAPFLTRT